MLIDSPLLHQSGNDFRLSARIQFDRPQRYPQTLWFRFDAEPSPNVDPFATALLLLAMKIGEPLEMRGTLSKKLFYGLQEYQKVIHAWYPHQFAIVDILPESLRSKSPPQDSLSAYPRTACAFSGGVDSFYTLLSLQNSPQNSPPNRRPPLHDTIFMGGFDMPLNLTQSIQALTQSYRKMMKDLDLNLIVGSTNVRNFVNTVGWTLAHGQALAAIALCFNQKWSQFFIPASYTYKTYPHWGSHPELDPLLSTETLQIIHHGAEANRVQKLKLISRHSESYTRLRVCWIQDIGLRNCGQCEKCIRTMIALDILESLHLYSTFHSSAFTRNQIRNLTQRTYQARLFARELIREAFWRGKYSTCLDLAYSLTQRKLRRTNLPVPL